ncbi:MAG: 3,4-dihydroxy-2-butanone-4-phosphate synthase [Gammaproteobacteria bacterium]|nr:3,4-dihydroxy-2-butanone-4-phosphate synthase [Gammaproteobacteria bacterium]
MALTDISSAVSRIAQGGLAVVVDDEERENEGDLIMAAELATPETVAFMIRHTSGIICAPAEAGRLEALGLPLMVEQNSDPLRTAFTVSTDYARGMTTGVSAEERARTLNALADDTVAADDFVRPGHIFPLRYRPGGVLVRSGHTASGGRPVPPRRSQTGRALAELNHDDGTMMRLPELMQFATEHGLPIISIEALIRYRAENEELVRERRCQPVMLNGLRFDAHVFDSTLDGSEITALVNGDIDPGEPVLVRVIKGAPGKDFMASAIAGDNVISRSLEMIGNAKQGVFIYLPPEEGAPADETTGAVWREVGVGSHILASLGVRRIHLLASKELSYPGIGSFGLEIETIIKES